MTESLPERPTEYEHIDRQQDRDVREADATYPIAVFTEGEQFVATQADATLEARGHSAAEAIANYARAVDAKTDGETVVGDE